MWAGFNEKNGDSWIDKFKDWLTNMVLGTYSPKEIADSLVPPTKLEMSYEGPGIPIMIGGQQVGEIPLSSLNINVPPTDTTVSGVR